MKQFAYISLFVCLAGIGLGGCFETAGYDQAAMHPNSEGGGAGYYNGPGWISPCNSPSYADCGRDSMTHHTDGNQN
jgi:hypothetical protein